METPVLSVPQNRGETPEALMGAPLLEVIHQGLYSSIALDAAVIPAELRFFGYQIGDPVPGAGAGVQTAVNIHTNMEIAGALATPKVFEVRGIRVYVSQMNADLTTTTGVVNPVALGAASLLDDMQRIFWGTDFRWHIGNKDYLTVPTHGVPPNVNLAGNASIDAASTAALDVRRILTAQGVGKYYSCAPYPTFIPSQQSFFAQLRATQLAANRPVLDVAHLVYCMLDGVLGREVQ